MEPFPAAENGLTAQDVEDIGAILLAIERHTQELKLDAGAACGEVTSLSLQEGSFNAGGDYLYRMMEAIGIEQRLADLMRIVGAFVSVVLREKARDMRRSPSTDSRGRARTAAAL